MASIYGSLLNSFMIMSTTIPEWILTLHQMGTLGELSCEEAWEAIENFTQGQKEWDNPPNINSKKELASLRAQAKRLFRNEKVWVEMPRFWVKWVGSNRVGLSGCYRVVTYPQVRPSFEVYTLPVSYPEEVEETIGIPMEVEPLEETQLEDLGLNTCNHEIPLSSREVLSFDEPDLNQIL
nr:ribonuclease H-like domain-containing protein [Tanacetum cinerariifolium]